MKKRKKKKPTLPPSHVKILRMYCLFAAVLTCVILLIGLLSYSKHNTEKNMTGDTESYTVFSLF